MKHVSIAYFGSPDFSAHLLSYIVSGELPVTVSFVVTQPDKPIGRKHILTPSPVKLMAKQYNIPVFESLDSPDLHRLLYEVDFAIVFAYGFKVLIKKELLRAPKIHFGTTGFGFVNVHPSLLPKYRGSSPITFPLMLGEEKTGVSLFVMDEKMDHGPIISQTTVELGSQETRIDLQNRLTEVAKQLISDLCSTCANKGKGALPLTEQNHDKATHAHYLMRDHGFVPLSTITQAMQGKALQHRDLPKTIQVYLDKYAETDPICRIYATKMINEPARTLYDFYRGISPWPGLWTIINKNGKKRLKITRAELQQNRFVINEVQLEGKKSVDFNTFIRAYNFTWL